MKLAFVLYLSLCVAQPDNEPIADVAKLREMLQDRQHPRGQSQAALLLLQGRSRDAEEIVRDGLRQTDSPQIFMALASGLRIQRDARFMDELFAVLKNGQPGFGQAAAEALAELADPKTILRLQSLAEDSRTDTGTRQLAMWALGQSGQKTAAIVLLDLLSSDEESIRQAAADALASITGQALGVDVSRWREWWEKHKDMAGERWLSERLAYQVSRARRLEGDLERTKGQLVRLHQQLYGRLPLADRLGQVQQLADHEDPAVRGLVVGWCQELIASTDSVGQRALSDLLLQLSRDGSLEVQRGAVLALSRIVDHRAYERLRYVLQKGRAPVRAAAARALPHQARIPGPDMGARQKQIVQALQKALEDPALEVVIEAAEGLGSMGVPEAGPVLTVLLRHPSGPVRQAAAQALERMADLTTLEGVIEALDDTIVGVRFSLMGAIGHAIGDGRALTEHQKGGLQERLENALVRDADPAVRSRAATVLGQFATPATLSILWSRVLAAEESRVQEKAWSAMIEVLARAGLPSLLHEWDRTVLEAKEGARRLQLLGEVHARWVAKEETKALAAAFTESLVQVQLEHGKWAAAFPLVRDLLARATSDAEIEARLRLLLTVGEQALKENNRAEAARVVQEAQAPLAKRPNLTADFERLQSRAKKEP